MGIDYEGQENQDNNDKNDENMQTEINKLDEMSIKHNFKIHK